MYSRHRIHIFIREIGSLPADLKSFIWRARAFFSVGYPNFGKSCLFDLPLVLTTPYERLNRSYGVGYAQADRNKNTEKY